MTKIDLGIYSLVALKKAAYKFKKVQILERDKNFAILELGDISEEVFYKELVDQDLREIIAKETEPVRNLILAQAFSKTSLGN
jgi:His-Xaa-Ser system protein HxsD